MQLVGLLVLVLLLPAAAPAQSDREKMVQELRKLQWQRGPAEGKIANKATIAVSPGHTFLDGPNTRHFLEIMGNPPRDNHYMIAPENLRWFAVFSFDSTGYVKDDEKIDADALLDTLKTSDGPANEERKRLGMVAIHTDGWHVAPHYSQETKRLEWGTRLRADDGSVSVNYSSRLLGRSGVMRAVLVSAPDSLNQDIAEYKNALKSYQFVGGERYADFKQGDKIAEYGLAALVVGGAAAAAAKSGILKSLGKFLWVILAGAAAGIWALFKKLFGRKDAPVPPATTDQK